MKTKSNINEIAKHENLRIFDCVPHSNEPRAMSEGYDILAMIDGYENEGCEILKERGYPLNVSELVDSRFDKNGNSLARKPLPRRIKDVMDMFAYFEAVRSFIQENNISFALCFMAYGVQAAMKARIRPAEDLFKIGASRRRKQKETRDKRKTWNDLTREQISARNQIILEHFNKTRLNPSSFADKHAVKYGIKPRTVRLILS